MKEQFYPEMSIKSIVPSKHNYRKTVDSAKMTELTASIKAKGVLQPILVRRINGKHEIVAGHRRYQASIDAGLETIPVIEKNLTDEEALEIQVIENSQREDPNPMEEAWGFKRLVDLGKHTPETLAAKIDHSVRYVMERISLLRLSDKAQEKVASGEISMGHALLLTRLKNQGDQKEFLQMITEREGMTVKEAQWRIKNFSKDIKDAVFDTESCKTCDFLSTNQTILFPELKKSGECMDRSCFFTKTRDHCKAIVDEKKKAGFTVYTDAKKVQALCGYNARSSARIVPPGTSDEYMSGIGSAVKPKRYKSECAKCTEHHAYFLYTEDGYRGKEAIFGEVCLKKSCLEKMNRPKNDKGSSAGGDDETERSNPYTRKAHARGCRDRFLLANMPARIGESETLRKRLLLHELLGCDEVDRDVCVDILCEYSTDFKKPDGWFGDETVYRGVMNIAADRLDEATGKALLSTIQEMNTDVLLMMTQEAGIDMMTQWGPDETFLKSKTKGELIEMCGQIGLEISAKESDKKGDIIAEILTHDLKGKLPPECVEACQARDEDDWHPEMCDDCDEDCSNCQTQENRTEDPED